MRFNKSAFICAACVGLAYAEQVILQSPAEEQPLYRINLTSFDAATRRPFLHQLDQSYDIWQTRKDFVDVRLAAEEFKDLSALLKTDDIRYERLAQDVYADLLKQAAATKAETPSKDFHSSYHSLDAIDAMLQILSSDYKDMATVVELGRSAEGRPIKALKVSRKSEYEKKGFLIVGGQHAREWISTASVVYLMHTLLVDGSSPEQREAVDDALDLYDFTFIPTINPDGYSYTFTTDRLWRKTRADVGDGCFGIDLNRNWDHHFSPSPRPNPCSDSFAGNEAFQGVELQGLRSYMFDKENDIQIFVDLHSFGQLIGFPFAYDCEDQPSAYEDLMEAAIGAAKAAHIHGRDFESGQICDISYTSSGDAVDWAYAEAGIKWSFSLELRDLGTYGFLLPAAQIRAASEEVYEMLLSFSSFIATPAARYMEDDEDTPAAEQMEGESYHERLNDVLGSPGARNDREGTEADTEDEGFVYTGADAIAGDVATFKRGYDQSMAAVLGLEGSLEGSNLHNGPSGLSESTNGVHNNENITPPTSPKAEQSTRSAFTSPTVSELAKSPKRPLPRSRSGLGMARPPSMLAQINKLRASQRFPSTSSIATIATIRSGNDIHGGSPASSRFDALSRQSSFSNIHDLNNDHNVKWNGQSSNSSMLESGIPKLSTNTLKWTPLRKVSAKIFPPRQFQTNGNTTKHQQTTLGQPTVMVAGGLICIGTLKGWVMVFDYSQTLKCVCGNDSLATTSGAVTAVALSMDHTFLAVGFATGAIHLYSLAKPAQPARTVQPVTLAQIQSGKTEGHLTGSSICHLGFVGARHTAIVSSDNRGLAFYHSLGQVFGLANTDIVRISGMYPEDGQLYQNSQNETATHAQTKQSTLFAIDPLPIGSTPHTSDGLSLVAIATSNKVLVVTLKSPAKTIWKSLRKVQEPSIQTPSIGSIAWFPAHQLEGERTEPLLAYSWGENVYIVRVREVSAVNGVPNGKLKQAQTTSLEAVTQWCAESTVLRLLWLNYKIIMLQSASHIDFWDVSTQTKSGRTSLDLRTVISPQIGNSQSAAYNVSTYKSKVFALALADIRVASIITWADRILSMVDGGNLLEAINLTTLYYQGLANTTAFGLPHNDEARHALVAPKLLEILKATTDYAFSEQRQKDDAQNGNGVDRSFLFHGLVDASVRAGLAMGDLQYTFNELFERYEENHVQGLFYERIGNFVVSRQLTSLPIDMAQIILQRFEESAQLDKFESAVYAMDISCWDINLILNACQTHGLLDLALHVYTIALKDWATPFSLCLSKVESFLDQQAESQDTDSIYERNDEALAQDAYKIFALISTGLRRQRYYDHSTLDEEEGRIGRSQTLNFLLSLENTQSLLEFDAEMLLDLLDNFLKMASTFSDGQPARHRIIAHFSTMSERPQEARIALQVDIFNAKHLAQSSSFESPSENSRSTVAEDTWLRLLENLIKAEPTGTDHQNSSLLPRALSALAATPSAQSLSYSALIERILDSDILLDGEKFPAFRQIFASVAESCRSEGEMIAMAKTLVDQDTFECVAKLSSERAKGWAGQSLECPICGRPTWGRVNDVHEQARLDSFNTASTLFEQLVPTQRPRLRRKESLKGKEVNWPEPSLQAAGVQSGSRRVPYEDLVVARSGVVYHRACYRSQEQSISEVA